RVGRLFMTPSDPSGGSKRRRRQQPACQIHGNSGRRDFRAFQRVRALAARAAETASHNVSDSLTVWMGGLDLPQLPITSPPSTLIAWPVMLSESGPARNETKFETS